MIYRNSCHFAAISALIIVSALGCNKKAIVDTSQIDDTSQHPGGSDNLVIGTLICDVSSFKPGVPFRIGVRLAVAERTHVYWRNPGDSGLPSGVDWTLPDGFTAGPLQWPAPIRFEIEETGDVSYGFDTESK